MSETTYLAWIPTHFVCALVNDDWSGLEPDEAQALTEWCKTHLLICAGNESRELVRDDVQHLIGDCYHCLVHDWNDDDEGEEDDRFETL